MHLLPHMFSACSQHAGEESWKHVLHIEAKRTPLTRSEPLHALLS